MSGKLKEVRERISSVISTQQITKAMKMVSAAKFRKAQQAILQMRPYSEKLNEILTHILTNLENDASSTFSEARFVEKALIVVVTSNRGLCGAFNSNVIKSALALLNDKYAEQHKQGNVHILCIGKRGLDYFRKRYKPEVVIGEHVDLFRDLSFENVSPVADWIMEEFQNKNYDAIDVAYGRFKNAATQYPESAQFLPVPKLELKPGKKWRRADYIFEPEKNELLDHLIPSILQTTFIRFMLDTHASEHGARMTAMDKATENAQELLGELRISYNKARQEAITSEISEIVGGAAALEG